MEKERVSIICSVYNGEKFLLQTIESCLQQVDVLIEIILIDDYSTDNSRTLITSLAEQHDNIKVIFNEKNLGFTRSVNKASKQATGDYLLVIGHDDLLPNDHLKKMLAEFDEDTAFVHCNSILIDEKNQPFGYIGKDTIQFKRNKKILRELSFFNCIYSTGLVMRMEKFKQVNGYPEEFRNFGEWYLWIKLTTLGNVKYTDVTRAYYRRHQTNMTHSFMDSKVNDELTNYYEVSRVLALRHLNLSKVGKAFYFLEEQQRVVNRKLRKLRDQIKAKSE